MRIVRSKTAVDDDKVESQIRSVVGEQLNVLGCRESRCLSGRLQVERENAPRLSCMNRLSELRNEQVRDH